MLASLNVERSMTQSNDKELRDKHTHGGNAAAGEVSSQISNKLQALYKSVEDQTIPDRFLDLLDQLDAAESRHTKGGH